MTELTNMLRVDKILLTVCLKGVPVVYFYGVPCKFNLSAPLFLSSQTSRSAVDINLRQYPYLFDAQIPTSSVLSFELPYQSQCIMIFRISFGKMTSTHSRPLCWLFEKVALVTLEHAHRGIGQLWCSLNVVLLLYISSIHPCRMTDVYAIILGLLHWFW